jgi:hypothetical protein
MVPDHDRAQKVVPDHDSAWSLVPHHNSACWYWITTYAILVPDALGTGFRQQSWHVGTKWLSWYRKIRHLEVKDSHMTNRALVHEILNSLTQ